MSVAPPGKPRGWSPPRWLALYDDFITRNASQVGQLESALRSLTYMIPGRFRDAEIASESVHSGVQLLSLYHDALLARPAARQPPGQPMPGPVTGTGAARSAHARYTRFWAQRSRLYRRVAMVLQMVVYTELVCEMVAKRRGGERARWRAVVAIEAVKAACRVLLLLVTRSRPLVTPALPEREAVPEAEEQQQDRDGDGDGDDDDDDDEEKKQEEEEEEEETRGQGNGMPRLLCAPQPHQREWAMPRTGSRLPCLPDPGDISSYLLGRVLTADDIRPAGRLLNRLRGGSRAAEVLHILAPLVYAVALARSRGKTSWTPWLAGLAAECAARQLRDASLTTTALERDEWNRRGWGMAWWAMRGAFYHGLTRGVVRGVRRRMPAFVAGIVEDYEYLWENYYFATSA
ncbi:uncharacterized protein UV8b_05515 [Ustilaginoidea virens]|uniref:Peroxisomal membrane protein PEX16 n=1 Tax=Ustilaginoidea virens TaxID=1159556 RepID=A0A063C069_USTVR|nr:uncharacterized protein UV8b_05515 [Ustilaginoidea virens]QUC21272.1 hypothetical protein UV8b_05515 [Ustilaginoidea virens]GAO17292.1 hypothetical protein UVI_02044510 [Ustilaginoidea virens]